MKTEETAEHTKLPWPCEPWHYVKSPKVGFNIFDRYDNPAIARVFKEGEVGEGIAKLFVSAPSLKAQNEKLLKALEAMQLTAIWLLENQPGETVPDWVSDTIQTAYDDESARAAIASAKDSAP